MNELVGTTATDLLALLETRAVSAEEVTRAHLDRVTATDGDVRALLRRLDEPALDHARDIDRRRGAGETLGALAGVPVVLKDNLTTRGVETTCASRILEHYRPPYDATVVTRLRAADAVVIGKANMDEFAMGSSTENSAFARTANPWDLGRVPGGSSGGSAAAVAACQAPVALGSDTGGSVRQPGAFCGVVGVKPTYGLVSRYGLLAFASSLDQIGPLARTVEDAARVLQAIAGNDPADATSLPGPAPDLLSALQDGVRDLRVGVVTEYQSEGGDDRVGARVRDALARLEKLGAQVAEVSVPHVAYGVAAYYLIAPSEASSNLSRYDGVRYGLRVPGATTEEMMAATREAGFGAEVKRRIMIGTYALSAGYYDAYYAQAQRVRTLIIRDLEAAYEQCDVLVGPTTPSTAFRFGENLDDPLSMYLQDVYTNAANLAGVPAVSVPIGLDDRGLPAGLQIMAPMGGEATMLRVARALEADLALDSVPRGPNAVEAP
ncbi:MAG: Asp-tRNA(Asn)/Glu-tRNA(Gln) amidotransferase subunit GatA [Egibacteraceae bacterium]